MAPAAEASAPVAEAPVANVPAPEPAKNASAPSVGGSSRRRKSVRTRRTRRQF
jgi:hypothetical protein